MHEDSIGWYFKKPNPYMKKSLLVIALAAWITSFAGNAKAQINTLATFNGPNGIGPVGKLILIDNTLYGTTQGGGGSGNWGTVYSLPISGGAPTILASFSTSGGNTPYGGLTLSGNTLYGTTAGGATSVGGGATVFSLPISGGVPTVLASLPSGSYGGLTLSENTLYGTTVGGGTYNNGTIFSLPVSGGAPTILASFNGENGRIPTCSLTLSGNTLYGTTQFGGTYGGGTVFSVPISGGTPTILASLDSTSGYGSAVGVTLSEDTLYGATSVGGAYGGGTVFSLPISGGTPTVLASVTGGNGTELILSGNTLYGTTGSTVFSLPISGGTPTVLDYFNGNNGTSPSGLLLDNGILYGTTTVGGSSYNGTVFSISTQSVPGSVPEPSTYALFGIGAIGMLMVLRRKKTA